MFQQHLCLLTSHKKYYLNYIYTFCSCYIQGDLHCTEGTHFIRSWTDHTSFAFLPAWSTVWLTGTSCGVIKLFCVMILWSGCCQCKQGSFISAVGYIFSCVLFCFHYSMSSAGISWVFLCDTMFLSKTQWLNWGTVFVYLKLKQHCCMCFCIFFFMTWLKVQFKSIYHWIK